MQWEVSLLLGFIILFGFWTTTSSDENYHTDFMGIKHYIMTPTVSEEQINLDEFTNVLFLKYRDPWKIFTGIVILIAGIFVALSQREQIQTFLQEKSRTLPKFTKPFSIHLSQNVEFFNQNNFCSTLLKKKRVLKINLKFKPSFFKVFVIIFSFLFLGPITFSTNAFAADTPVSVTDIVAGISESTIVASIGIPTNTHTTTFDIVTFDADSAVTDTSVSPTDTIDDLLTAQLLVLLVPRLTQ